MQLHQFRWFAGSWDEDALCQSKDIQIQLSEQFNNPYKLKESLKDTKVLAEFDAGISR